MNGNHFMAAAVALLCASSVIADRPAPELAYVVRSPNEQFEFRMYPAGPAGARPFGQAFRAAGAGEPSLADGRDESLWRVEDWYSSETFIADDGRSLVRMGPWAGRPPCEELAVAFYRDGVEQRRYSVADLVEDASAVERSVSHYSWQSREDGFPRMLGNGRFQLRTIENRTLTFDVATGEILGDGSHPQAVADQPQAEPDDADPGRRFVGEWVAAPCSERRYRRELTLAADGTFEATDYVSPCPRGATCVWSGIVAHSGTWTLRNAGMILLSTSHTDPQGSPLPSAMGFDTASGRLHEATPGAAELCEYERR